MELNQHHDCDLDKMLDSMLKMKQQAGIVIRHL